MNAVTSNSLLFLTIASVALFLIGVNAAVVYRFWPEPWLVSKLVAVSGLLSYVALSVLYGNPATWRALIGAVAILVDCAAIGGIWHALHKAEKGEGVLVAYRRR